MGETFCCMVCRLLQERSPACVECGAATMVSLEQSGDVLKFGNLTLHNTPTTRREKLAQAAGMTAILAGYAGIIAGAAMWWPAIPIIIGAGTGGFSLAAWRARDVPIAEVERFGIAVAKGAVEKHGIARKLTDSVRSIHNGAPVLVEEVVIRRPRGGVMLRRTNAVPFVVDVEGERVVIAGTVRVTSKPVVTRAKKSDPRFAALGIPPAVPVAGVLETVQVRDGDTIKVTGALSVEMLPELAFHRDAGESTVMRGAPNAVIAIACESGTS